MPDGGVSEPRIWVARPAVWYAAASMVTTILHELTHATTALALGVPSTLLNYSANLDLTPAQAATNIPAIIRVAGPLLCLVAGSVSLLSLARARGSALELPLLYLSVFGIGTFFGNMMSTSFVGDFSQTAVALGLSMPARYALSAVGALALAALHFWAGRRLAGWVPAGVGRLAGMLRMIILPVAVGTAVVLLVNMPMPMTSVNTRVAEASFWLFAAAGALMTGPGSRSERGGLVPHWSDGVVFLLAVLAVRLMIRGIPFVP